MTWEDWSRIAQLTRGKFDNEESQLICGTLGLCDEAGEISGMVKKHLYHGHEFDRVNLIEELGDLLWYVLLLLDMLHVDIENVLAVNAAKLQARYPEGEFSTERSLERDLAAERAAMAEALRLEPFSIRSVEAEQRR